MKKILLSLLALLSMTCRADEGMWTLHDLDQRTVAVMQSLGLEMTARQLYAPGQQGALKDAVVLFGGYCSGVVVSPQGLVFTNHHCGYGSIQQLSSPTEDLLKDGFVARTAADERPVPGLFVAFLDSVMDVTAEVQRLSEEMDVELACDSVERKYNGLGNSRTLDSYYGGTKFFLSIYRRYDDVRLAFTVPESLGKFGGDTDNWMWPRQTCDFSVFRIYADSLGQPAEYSASNIPLATPRHARVTLEGQNEGGYCMTLGYPGSTERYLSSYGITTMMNTENTARANVRGVLLEVWRAHMAADRTVGIKYSSKAANSSNYWKNSIGMNRALKTLKVEREKRQLEGRIDKWIKQDKERVARFGGVTKRLKRNYAAVTPDMLSAFMLHETLRGIDCYSIIRSLRNLSIQDNAADSAVVLKRLADLYKNYDMATDRDATRALLANAKKQVKREYLPEDLRECKDVAQLVDSLFDNSALLTPEAVTLDRQTINEDPLTVFCTDLNAEVLSLFSQIGRTTSEINHDEDLLTQAYLEMNFETPHYSDANMTMRVSFGTVKPYTNTEGTHYDCFTYPASLLEKANNGNPDYVMQPEVVQLFKDRNYGRYANEAGDLPLCFLTTNDITGGNSGSPMFNGKGELLGLAFDGNWDALSSDVKFNASMTRCIGVDIRYVMFLIDCWGHADRLVREVLD